MPSWKKKLTDGLQRSTWFVSRQVRGMTDHFSTLKNKKQEEVQEISQMNKRVMRAKAQAFAADHQQQGIAFDLHSSFLFWLMAALVVYLWFVIYQGIEIVYLIFTALIISIAIESLIVFFQKYIPRGISIGISYIIIIVIALSWILFIVPFLLGQIGDIVAHIVEYARALQASLAQQDILTIIDKTQRLPQIVKTEIITSLSNGDAVRIVQSTIQQNISGIISAGTSYIDSAGNIAADGLGYAFGIVGNVVWSAFNIVLTFTLAILFSIEKEQLVRFLAHLNGRGKAGYRRLKIETLYKKLGLWLKGQLYLGIFIGVCVYLALWILHIAGMPLESKGTLALISWLTEFVPYIWPILGAIPAVIMAISLYGFKGLFVVGLVYALIQWIENNVLIPLIMNKTLWVSPTVIFISALVGWVTLWFVGILLAVPLAVIATLLYKQDVE